MSAPSNTEPVESDLSARISNLEHRLAMLEGSKTGLSRLSAALRFLILLPVIALPLLFVLQGLAEYRDSPFGAVCLLAWAFTVVLWLIAELFTTNRFRFSLARLVVATALLCVVMGFGKTQILSPLTHQETTLASLNGLTGSVHRKPFGPTWLRWLLGDKYFERVVQLEIKGPDGGDAEIEELTNLPHLRCVFFTGPGFTDNGLNSVAKLPKGTQVIFTGTMVTQEGIERLREIQPGMDVTLQ